MTREPSLRPAVALAAVAALAVIAVWLDTRNLRRRGRYREDR